MQFSSANLERLEPRLVSGEKKAVVFSASNPHRLSVMEKVDVKPNAVTVAFKAACSGLFPKGSSCLAAYKLQFSSANG